MPSVSDASKQSVRNLCWIFHYSMYNAICQFLIVLFSLPHFSPMTLFEGIEMRQQHHLRAPLAKEIPNEEERRKEENIQRISAITFLYCALLFFNSKSCSPFFIHYISQTWTINIIIWCMHVCLNMKDGSANSRTKNEYRPIIRSQSAIDSGVVRLNDL